jgi:hypothetical protein
MRDSVSSFQNYNTLTANVSPGSSPSERNIRTRNKFRHIAQISSIFASYNNQNRNLNVNFYFF